MLGQSNAEHEGLGSILARPKCFIFLYYFVILATNRLMVVRILPFKSSFAKKVVSANRPKTKL